MKKDALSWISNCYCFVLGPIVKIAFKQLDLTLKRLQVTKYSGTIDHLKSTIQLASGYLL